MGKIRISRSQESNTKIGYVGYGENTIDERIIPNLREAGFTEIIRSTKTCPYTPSVFASTPDKRYRLYVYNIGVTEDSCNIGEDIPGSLDIFIERLDLTEEKKL